MPDKIDTLTEKGIAFYLPRRRDVDESIRIHHTRRVLYEDILGPVPLVELTEPLPSALTQLPRLLWGTSALMYGRRRDNVPEFGDMVVCIKNTGGITIGFFTSRGYADDLLEKFPFVKWPNQKTKDINGICGFLYFPGSFLDSCILYDIKEIMNDNGYT